MQHDDVKSNEKPASNFSSLPSPVIIASTTPSPLPSKQVTPVSSVWKSGSASF